MKRCFLAEYLPIYCRNIGLKLGWLSYPTFPYLLLEYVLLTGAGKI